MLTCTQVCYVLILCNTLLISHYATAAQYLSAYNVAGFIRQQAYDEIDDISTFAGQFSTRVASDVNVRAVIAAFADNPNVTDLNPVINDDGDTLLHLAAEYNDFSFIRYLPEKRKKDNIQFTVFNAYHETPLHTAVRNGNTLCIQPLIKPKYQETGVDVNAQNMRSETALHIATQYDDGAYALSLVEILTSSEDINITIKNDDNQKPIDIAIDRGRLDIARRLLSTVVSSNYAYNEQKYHVDRYSSITHMANPIASTLGDTIIHQALKNNNTQIVQYIVSQGGDVNVNHENEDGNSMLHIAAMQGYNDIFRDVLNAYPSININQMKNKDGDTPFHILASKTNDAALIQAFLNAGADPNIRNINGKTPYAMASQNIRKTIRDNAKIDLSIEANRAAYFDLHNSVRNAHVDTVQEYINQYPKDPNPIVIPGGGMKLLHTAIFYKQFEIVKLLLNYDIDLNETDKSGRSPLHIAIIKHESEKHHIIRHLLYVDGNIEQPRDNIDPNQCNPYYFQPKAEISLKSLFGIMPGSGAFSPLLLAIYRCAPQEIFDLLIKHPKTNPNIMSKDPLWYVKQSDFYNITYDVRDKDGYEYIFYSTPLQFLIEGAYKNGTLKVNQNVDDTMIENRLVHMCKALIEHGADTRFLQFREDGITAADTIESAVISHIMQAYLNNIHHYVTYLKQVL